MTRLLYQEVLGAAGAGCASTVLGHPLDTIKTHLQMQTHQTQTSWQVAKSLRYGLWRGMGPPLMNAIVMNTVMFSVFENIKQSLGGEKGGDHTNPNLSTSLLAGIGSGIATACISTPTDYVKIHAQLSSSSSSSLEIVRQTLTNNPTAFYRGHVANLLREGIFTMVYLGLYDQARPQGFGEVALTSSMTGALAWVASYPADTIKTMCQAQGISFQEATKQIWSRGNNNGSGSRGSIANFYKGCGTSTGRAILVTTSRMIVYEWILGQFQFIR
jgi:solute carrier family 25 carnitine/acylcarnitine transporter 20/29